MIVVDDFPALDHAEGGAYLRRCPPPGLGNTDQHGVRAFTSRKTVSLRCRDAEIPVQGIICGFSRELAFGNTARTAILIAGTGNLRPSSGEEGQQESDYQCQGSHAVQR